MAKQLIDRGTVDDPLTGDSLYEGADKINSNATELYDKDTAQDVITDAHIVNVANPHNVTKTQVGLGNVDNTSDVNKPISTATQIALDLKAYIADLKFIDGTNPLDAVYMVRNVGVNTLTPVTNVEITGNGNSASITGAQLVLSINDATVSSNNGARLVFNAGAGGAPTLKYGEIAYLRDGKNTFLFNNVLVGDIIFAQAGATKMVIDSDGNAGFGIPLPKSQIHSAGGVQMGDDTDVASIDKVGTMRYRSDANNSYMDECMKTGAITYAWVNIKTNSW